MLFLLIILSLTNSQMSLWLQYHFSKIIHHFLCTKIQQPLTYSHQFSLFEFSPFAVFETIPRHLPLEDGFSFGFCDRRSLVTLSFLISYFHNDLQNQLVPALSLFYDLLWISILSLIRCSWLASYVCCSLSTTNCIPMILFARKIFT